ncbi:GNAT family N-acetyltransferase [Methanobacterium alcaliphilum]|uniref:GNAT family N-acetyltransferase n=1 Tax=Methanobacterium alcaliphilum TaxID=392018 RepID=UPI00200A4A61|nr:GNAT family protein [Methanobacterium alcaliphilum]MCK9150805.1 GNAT family N-acetyltransferase [Methanobacterium alcaliphilum]
MIRKCRNCTLKSWNPIFLESMVKNANNPLIALNLRDIFPNPYTIQDGIQWIQIAQKEKPKLNFAITIDNEAIGGIGFILGQDIEKISAEIGYWLGEKYWGKGITSSAVKSMVEYGFNELKLKRIFAKPFENNIASRKVLEKNRFQLEGILKNSVIKKDKLCNQALYAITRD